MVYQGTYAMEAARRQAEELFRRFLMQQSAHMSGQRAGSYQMMGNPYGTTLMSASQPMQPKAPYGGFGGVQARQDMGYAENTKDLPFYGQKAKHYNEVKKSVREPLTTARDWSQTAGVGGSGVGY